MNGVLSTPIAWRDDRHDGLNGIVDFVLSPELLKPNTTVKDLVAALNDQLPQHDTDSQRVVRHVELYGTIVKDTYPMASLMLQLSPATPRLVVRTRPARTARVVFSVRDLTGKDTIVQCDYHDTVYDIKTRLREIKGIPEDLQTLNFAGRVLEDHQELVACNISKECRVYLLFRLRGGGIAPGTMFADVSNNTLLEAQSFSKTAPSWRTVDKGLNVEGRCELQQCTEYGQMVISDRKFQAFNLITDTIHCPCCYKVVKPITCGLYDCRGSTKV